ncbi:hypothetical protein LX32DRAFT_655887 [Colletotrichum zoysiae]|uniref:Uncharacterized protein n=1 Tax=Colletotrichum zoysiae TaxID=1216348 RepID=A0AAD9HB80_9PEZI|nr:hypothetical protein LX32DRAFT_655887 [Colletotrichum zoysiae]
MPYYLSLYKGTIINLVYIIKLFIILKKNYKDKLKITIKGIIINSLIIKRRLYKTKGEVSNKLEGLPRLIVTSYYYNLKRTIYIIKRFKKVYKKLLTIIVYRTLTSIIIYNKASKYYIVNYNTIFNTKDSTEGSLWRKPRTTLRFQFRFRNADDDSR